MVRWSPLDTIRTCVDDCVQKYCQFRQRLSLEELHNKISYNFLRYANWFINITLCYFGIGAIELGLAFSTPQIGSPLNTAQSVCVVSVGSWYNLNGAPVMLSHIKHTHTHRVPNWDAIDIMATNIQRTMRLRRILTFACSILHHLFQVMIRHWAWFFGISGSVYFSWPTSFMMIEGICTSS